MNIDKTIKLFEHAGSSFSRDDIKSLLADIKNATDTDEAIEAEFNNLATPKEHRQALKALILRQL